jgi:hypothetical protein
MVVALILELSRPDESGVTSIAPQLPITEGISFRRGCSAADVRVLNPVAFICAEKAVFT